MSRIYANFPRNITMYKKYQHVARIVAGIDYFTFLSCIIYR